MQPSRQTLLRQPRQPEKRLKRFTGFRAALAIAAFIALLGSLPFTSTSNPFTLNALAKPVIDKHHLTHPSVTEHSGHHDDQGSASLEALPEKMQDYLGLSAEQHATISRLSKQGRNKSLPLSEKLIATRQKLWIYLKSPGATEAGAKKQVNELRALRHPLGEMRLHTWFAIREVLTEKQLEKLQHSPL